MILPSITNLISSRSSQDNSNEETISCSRETSTPEDDPHLAASIGVPPTPMNASRGQQLMTPTSDHQLLAQMTPTSVQDQSNRPLTHSPPSNSVLRLSQEQINNAIGLYNSFYSF